MTDPTSHVSSEELADHDVGLLTPAREAEVTAHLAGCAACTATLERIRRVSLVLAGQPAPPVPPAVAARLDETLAGLARTRDLTRGPGDGPDDRSGDGPGAGPGDAPAAEPDELATRLRRRVPPGGTAAPPLLQPPRPTIGTLELNLQRHRRRPARVLGLALGAAALAGVVGFGGYLLSAVSGHNEPSADSPVVVNGNRLGESSAVTDHAGLSPHRFSEAWNCARKVTDGRITGIESSVVNDTPGLLVYLAGAAGSTRVVFVSGCDDQPTAGPSAVLPHS